ncbi:MAG: class I SAM-dependent methyltransferase [Actinomycetota bacterium]
MSSAAVWHDVECGGYAADLPVWARLAGASDGPVLELGCGTGRVALRLAAGKNEVWAVDADASLLASLQERAAAQGLPVRAICADIRALDLDRDFELILAPMQLLQMLGSAAARHAALERAAGHLAPGGRLAAAIVEPPSPSLDGPAAALPDVQELDGWVYSSLPAVLVTAGGDLEIHRHRQAVSPDGSLSEEEHTDRLDALGADALEAEAATPGLRPAGRLEVPATDGYLGSTVVILERP